MGKNAVKRVIGSFWLKEKNDDKGGHKRYLTGNIHLGAVTIANVVIFPNRYKTHQKHPDYKMFLFEDVKKRHPDINDTKSSGQKQGDLGAGCSD